MAASGTPTPDLLPRVAAWLTTRLDGLSQVSVGLSGGCDSVVLLHLLHRLALPCRLQPVHVHHGLSPHADAWADFCIRLSAGWGLACQVHRVDVRVAPGEGLEAAARRARQAVFREVAGEVLCLAHHQDDQAETVLFNLLRGSGIAGLAGMRAERRMNGQRWLRPLLGIPRREIEAYARQHGLTWVTDESNADLSLTRNFLRHAALPLLGTRFPGVSRTLARLAGHCDETAGLLAELAAADWAAAAVEERLRLVALRALSAPRQKNLLRWRLQQLGWQVPASIRLTEFVRQLQTAGPDRHPELVLAEGRLWVARGELHFTRHGSG